MHTYYKIKVQWDLEMSQSYARSFNKAQKDLSVSRIGHRPYKQNKDMLAIGNRHNSK